MKLLFDTNVVLDLILDRTPFAAVAGRLVARVERRQVQGFLGATTVTALYYLLRKELGGPSTLDTLRRLMTLFAIAPVDHRTLTLALESGFTDFEDAVLHEAARLAGTDGLITRNLSDFAAASLPVYAPEEADAILAGLEG